MNFAFGLFTFLLSVFIAYSAAKNFWSAPLSAIMGDPNYVEDQAEPTPTPTPIPTSTSTSATSTTSTSITIIPTSTATTTSTLPPCANGCIVTIGTSDGPFAPPPYNTNYNGANPMISSYPTTQP